MYVASAIVVLANLVLSLVVALRLLRLAARDGDSVATSGPPHRGLFGVASAATLFLTFLPPAVYLRFAAARGEPTTA